MATILISELKTGDLTYATGNTQAPLGLYRVTRTEVDHNPNRPSHMAKTLIRVWGVNTKGGKEIYMTRLPADTEVHLERVSN